MRPTSPAFCVPRDQVGSAFRVCTMVVVSREQLKATIKTLRKEKRDLQRQVMREPETTNNHHNASSSGYRFSRRELGRMWWGSGGFPPGGGTSGGHGRCWPLQEKKWRRAVSKCSTILLKETQKAKGAIKTAKDAHRSVRKTFNCFRSRIKRMARSQGSVTLEQIEHLLAM